MRGSDSIPQRQYAFGIFQYLSNMTGLLLK
jgi:hypothetical protein